MCKLIFLCLSLGLLPHILKHLMPSLYPVLVMSSLCHNSTSRCCALEVSHDIAGLVIEKRYHMINIFFKEIF